MPEKAPRLYLVTPLLDGNSPVVPVLAAIEAGDVASVLLRLRPGVAEAEKLVRAFAGPLQDRGVAVLVETPALVIPTGADGAHVSGYGPAFSAAIKSLAPNYIVGVGGLATRDDAMRAGEEGADYLLFGDVSSEGETPSLEQIVERTRWSSELLTTPCVALAQRSADVGPLTEAGADFIMLGDWVWLDVRGPAAAIADAAARVSGAA
jgi:thiamine-phosphate pyrophosphorylase